MSSPTASYYAFGAVADRLIQIEVTSDFRVRILRRTRNLLAWTTDTGTDTGYLAAANPALPIEIKVAVDACSRSFGLCAVSSSEWGSNPYDCHNAIRFLGADEPIGDDLDWRPGMRLAGASSISEAVYTLDSNGRLKSVDQVLGSWSFEMDLNKVFSASATRKRSFIVLRVSGSNQGSVTVTNTTTPVNLKV
jgi:hypothetical protein